MTSDPDKRAERPGHHDATPGSSPDRSASTESADSFPASDPVASTVATGTRAVDPARLSFADDESERPEHHNHSITARFRSREAAKLALERLVRDIPLDRRCASLEPGRRTTLLKVMVDANDAARIGDLMHSCGGRLSSSNARHLSGRSAKGTGAWNAVEALIEAASSAVQSAIRGRPVLSLGLVAGVGFLLGVVSRGNR